MHQNRCHSANHYRQLGWWSLLLFTILFAPWIARAQQPQTTAVLVGMEGSVELFHAKSTNWIPATVGAKLNVSDQLRTGSRSRATVRLSNLSVLRVGELMSYEIEPPRAATGQPTLNLKAGAAYFFSRDKPAEVQIRTPTVTGAIRGTEFNVLVAADGSTTVTMIDGEVELANSFGATSLTSGDAGQAEPGRAPVKTAVLIAANVIQWNLYYPGVLDVNELDLSSQEQALLAESLAAYRIGELLTALKKYPANHQPASAADHLYLGALLLSVGLVDQTLPHLEAASDAKHLPLANALRQLIAAVKFERWEEAATPKLATEFLSASYYEQSRGNLSVALTSARKAVEQSPSFGFGWVRVAELEFSFGHTDAALSALDKNLWLGPRNPQALALKGFLLAAQNQIGDALQQFDRAIALDASLGNAWLGSGLCKIRQGHAEAGREDLQVAAALEPNRAVLRSYLGKAFSQTGDNERAGHELELARKFDPNDPTSWLYSALLHQEQNRVNEAVRDLEKSQALNDNRALFRSKMLLDQDRAVRSANLAGLYRDAGMTDVSLREAARAVAEDYANDAAHLFISDSFNELRDPTRFNLRQESVWFNELLLANLLAPVGAGRLAQNITQQEYTKLFESDGLGGASQTTYRSDGQIHQLVSQFSTFRNTSWAFDLDYQHNDGVRPNNELDRTEWYTTLKQQLTPADSVLLLVKYQDYVSGDNFQYYNPSNSFRPHFIFEEEQHPILVGGFQHEWSPGIRTLLLGGRLVNEQKFSDVQANQLLLFGTSPGVIGVTDARPFDIKVQNQLEIYTAELNQVVQQDRFTLVAGALWQGGQFDFQNSLVNPPLPPFFLPPVSASFSEPFERYEGYAYLTVKPVEKVWLTGGVSYDHVVMPDNYRNPPFSAGTAERYRLGPKAALVWNPIKQATLRGIYSQSLGGVSLDQSYRLEPSQLAGFPQSFRTVISESLVGSVAAPEHDVMALALDLKFGSGTYGGLQVERITSAVDRNIGVFRIENSLAPYRPSTTRELLDYEEQSFSLNVNQLLGGGFVVGADYRLTQSELKSTLPEIPVAGLPGAVRDETALLHELGGYILYNHPSGFFARFDGRYYRQSNKGFSPNLPGDGFVQLDLFGGYRFWHRKAELQLGILNLTGQDYRLNPLTPYSELPRERVFTARFNFRF